MDEDMATRLTQAVATALAPLMGTTRGRLSAIRVQAIVMTDDGVHGWPWEGTLAMHQEAEQTLDKVDFKSICERRITVPLEVPERS